VHRIEASYRSRLGNTEAVHAQITSASKIKYIPHAVREKLLAAYEAEFVREGSYMQHPSQGHVVTFSINSQPTGFFYLEDTEQVTNGGTQSLQQHLETGTLAFEDLPQDLQRFIFIYLTQVPQTVDLRTVGEVVARPKRFYVYPEAQGNGALKVLLSLVTLTTALLNEDSEDIHQLVEARAGLTAGTPLRAGSTSSVTDHQLVPAYLAMGYDLSRSPQAVVAQNADPTLSVLGWENDPYNNVSITKKIPAEFIRSLVYSSENID